MNLTKDLIPLPYSDCILTPSRLRNHSHIVFETSDNLRKTLKIINKNNRKLNETNSNLDARHLTCDVSKPSHASGYRASPGRSLVPGDIFLIEY